MLGDNVAQCADLGGEVSPYSVDRQSPPHAPPFKQTDLSIRFCASQLWPWRYTRPSDLIHTRHLEALRPLRPRAAESRRSLATRNGPKSLASSSSRKRPKSRTGDGGGNEPNAAILTLAIMSI